MTNLSPLAQIKLAPPGGLRGIGPLGLEGAEATAGISVFNRVISATIGIMTIVATIWFIFLIISGAIALMNAGGDSKKLTEAKDKITNAIVGLVVVIAAVFIIDLIGGLFGLDILRGALVILTPGFAP